MGRGGWFSDDSLRAQWRIAQFVVGFPIALWLVIWVVVLVVEPGSAFDWIRALMADPRALIPLVLGLAFVLWVDRHLERSKPVPPPAQTVDQA